jgi:hypothetical protein
MALAYTIIIIYAKNSALSIKKMMAVKTKHNIKQSIDFIVFFEKTTIELNIIKIIINKNSIVLRFIYLFYIVYCIYYQILSYL